MSLHQSLKVTKGLAKHRNVLKKRERISRLVSEGRWLAEGASALGLPKIRNIKVAGRKGKAKAKPAATEAAVAAKTTPGTAATGEGVKPTAS